MARIKRDPYDEFLDEDYKLNEWLKTRPVCDYCQEPIQEGYAYRINNEIICPTCVDNVFRFWIDE